MRKFRLLLVVTLLVQPLFSGCSYVREYRERQLAEQREAAEAQVVAPASGVEELVNYGSYLSILSENELKAECGRLNLEMQQQDRPSGNVYQALAIMLMPECGSLEQARDILIQEINQTSDEQLHRFLVLQISLLDRMIRQRETKDVLSRELKTSRQQQNRLRQQMQTIESEREALRFKLDELKSIEKTLNRREEGRIQ